MVIVRWTENPKAGARLPVSPHLEVYSNWLRGQIANLLGRLKNGARVRTSQLPQMLMKITFLTSLQQPVVAVRGVSVKHDNVGSNPIWLTFKYF